MDLRAKALLAAALWCSVGCSTVRSGARRVGDSRYAPYRGRVELSALRDPARGELVGRVEASGMTTIEELVPEFQRRVAALGGDYGRVDSVRTRVERRVVPQVTYYNCGFGRFVRQCSQVVYTEEELSMTFVEGRAFRVQGAP